MKKRDWIVLICALLAVVLTVAAASADAGDEYKLTTDASELHNGDRIILRHRFNAVFLDSVVITAADVPLDTMEDLRSFLRQASEKYTSAAVTIYLPAATYEGDLDLSSRGFEFIGSTENGRQTSFRGHIRVSDRTL